MTVSYQPGDLATITDLISLELLCVNNITVVDTTPPSIACVPEVVLPFSGATTAAGVAIAFPAPITDDGDIVRVSVPAAAAMPPNTTRTVNATAVDSAGNERACTTTLRAVDVGAPVLTGCVANITTYAVGSGAGNRFAPLILPEITAFDVETNTAVDVSVGLFCVWSAERGRGERGESVCVRE